MSRVWPDPVKQAEEMRKLQEMAQDERIEELKAEVELLLAQVELNKIEAKSTSKFIAGWRPAVGWVGAISLALATIPKALVLTIMWTWQAVAILNGYDPTPLSDGTIPNMPDLPSFPDLGTGDVIAMLGSMLGIGIMRSVDKRNKVDTQELT